MASPQVPENLNNDPRKETNTRNPRNLNNVEFDTQGDFTKNFIDEHLRIKKANTAVPSHTVRKFLDQFYFQSNGDIWINNENSWKRVYQEEGNSTFPDVLPYATAGTPDVRSVFSDDFDNFPAIQDDVVPTVHVQLFTSCNSQLLKSLSGVTQRVKPTDIWAAVDTIRGVLVYDGYFYWMGDDAGTYRIYRCSTSVDIATTGNWTQMTISGTAITGTSYLAGVYDTKIWIATGSAFVPYALSGTTLTSGTGITVTGSDYNIESRVNDNGIYASFSSSPYTKRATHAGVIETEFSGGNSTTYTTFVTPTKFFITMYDNQNHVVGLVRAD